MVLRREIRVRRGRRDIGPLGDRAHREIGIGGLPQHLPARGEDLSGRFVPSSDGSDRTGVQTSRARPNRGNAIWRCSLSGTGGWSSTASSLQVPAAASAPSGRRLWSCDPHSVRKRALVHIRGAALRGSRTGWGSSSVPVAVSGSPTSRRGPRGCRGKGCRHQRRGCRGGGQADRRRRRDSDRRAGRRVGSGSAREVADRTLAEFGRFDYLVGRPCRLPPRCR